MLKLKPATTLPNPTTPTMHSSLRSLLLRHNARLLHFHPHLRPQNRNPSSLLSSSSSAAGGRWASYDPVSDRHLSDSDSDSATVGAASSDSELESNSPVWAVYDPVADRVVMRPRPPAAEAGSETTSEETPRSESKRGKSAKGTKEPSLASLASPWSAMAAESGSDDSEEEPKSKPNRDKAAKAAKKPPLGSGGSPSGPPWSAMAASSQRRKGAKVKMSYVCENCGESYSQWWGVCRGCEATGSLKIFVETEVNRKRGVEVPQAVRSSWLPEKLGEAKPQSLADVNKGRDQSEWRIPLSGHFGMEVSRVLGGGIVPGSLVLVGGDPGVGKSSLLLQIAANVAEGFKVKEPPPVIYVSGEESIEQIGNRADRMRITTRNLYLYSSTDVEDILDKIQPLSPGVLIIDSIQTVYLKGFVGSAGNSMQVRECTSALLRFAKETNIPVFLIGHVTKSGDIAGPRLLEHIVDVVLYLEGERCSSYRLLRSVKNRFGSTDELGVFEMSESGLQAVMNPSEMFLTENSSDFEILVGLAAAVILDGSRTFVIEVQALCASSSSTTGEVNGLLQSRVDIIISVLMKQAGLKLQDSAIFLNVVSGYKLTETAGDLAVATAICSSFLEFPIPNDIAFIGEIGLGGELRTVPRMDKRVIAIAKLGYKKCIVPKTAEKMLTSLNLDITIVGCKNLKEVINTVFSSEE